MTSADALHARRARRVTYGLVAVLLIAALAHLELWPLTSFRLFSSMRTATGSTLQLVATTSDGVRTTVPAKPQMLARLPEASDVEAVTMVDAWLDDAGLDLAQTRTVTLERRMWRLDPETMESHETGRVVLREVEP